LKNTINKTTAANTGNMGMLFVMLFAFNPSLKDICNSSCNQTSASARNINPAP
jgi:hypothetical protein